jgi:F-type H+-transporting ATPase subunit epsilon
MHLDIVSLEETIYSGRVEALFVTGTVGELGIYPGHAQLLTSIKPGEIRLQVKNEETVYYVSGGMLEVQPHSSTILADTVIRANNLDEAAVKQAKENAEKAMANKQSEMDYSRAQAELVEALAQLRAIRSARKKYNLS